MGEKVVDISWGQISWVSFVVKVDVLTDPVEIYTFSFGAVFPTLNLQAHLVQQLWFRVRGGFDTP